MSRLKKRIALIFMVFAVFVMTMFSMAVLPGYIAYAEDDGSEIIVEYDPEIIEYLDSEIDADSNLEIITDYNINTDPDQWYTTDDTVFYADGILVYYKGEDVTKSENTRIMFNSVPKEVYNDVDGYYTIPIRAEYHFLSTESTIKVKIVSALHLGDVSGNGSIDLMDAILISKYILGSVSFSNAQKKNADYNQNGRIDLNDVIGISKYIVSK